MISERELVRAALDALGIRRLALAVHDAALPGDPRDDVGRGAPLSKGGLAFLRFAADLGFDAVQLGPQGETTEHDQSPYDASIFSRSTLSLALAPLEAAGLLPAPTLREAVAGRPAGALERAAHRHAHAVAREALDQAFARFEARHPRDQAESLELFVARQREWLDRDALYAAAATEHGARLFSSPDLPDLAPFAVARPEQLDRAARRYSDGWVRSLSHDQVARYAVLFDTVLDAARAHGRAVDDLLCEVLSTQPYPVERVVARHGLGRFRVTQKVVLGDPADVYRSENAAPVDWIMAGTHDTEPVWRVAERWVAGGSAPAHAAYLAQRLVADVRVRSGWVERVAGDASRLALAKLAELFVGPARNVMVMFTDLLGMREVYNRPGTVSEENWSLRVPPDFEARYAGARLAGRALDLPRVLSMAIRARGVDLSRSHAALLAALDQRAGSDPNEAAP